MYATFFSPANFLAKKMKLFFRAENQPFCRILKQCPGVPKNGTFCDSENFFRKKMAGCLHSKIIRYIFATTNHTT